ncbi:MAG TPA: dihydroorotate dehydrogenase [Planctomycetota bacterium]|nr:dihydroorotate dehydrogenase [Planctomycetota bacterium]
MAVDLSTRLGPLTLANPVLVASGTFGFGMEMSRVADVRKLGAVVMKSLTVKPRSGNPPPRIVETPAGMLNAIGLENPGIDGFLRTILPQARNLGVPLVANIAGSTVEDYVTLAGRLTREATGGIVAIEMNVSCPNVGAKGLHFGVSPELLKGLVAAVRAETKLPLVVKLSPNVTDVVEVAKAALAGGADALTLINTLLGMAVDVKTRRPKLANITGGLSGPAVKPVALRMVHQVWQATKAPIIGLGGIATADDALEFIIAGASAVSVGTWNFVEPTAAAELPEKMAARAAELGISRLSELVGTLNLA